MRQTFRNPRQECSPTFTRELDCSIPVQTQSQFLNKKWNNNIDNSTLKKIIYPRSPSRLGFLLISLAAQLVCAPADGREPRRERCPRAARLMVFLGAASATKSQGITTAALGCSALRYPDKRQITKAHRWECVSKPLADNDNTGTGLATLFSNTTRHLEHGPRVPMRFRVTPQPAAATRPTAMVRSHRTQMEVTTPPIGSITAARQAKT